MFLWSLAVCCGCLGLFGIGFSTVSAQSGDDLFVAAADVAPACRRKGRRHKPGGRQAKPGGGAEAASYSRYSCDLQREESITDQQRKCQERAAQNGHQIVRELQFADEEVSGTKLKRDGLDALVKAAAEGRFDVLYFHNLSRLARESVITMPVLKQLVHVHKIRVISVTEGLDSDREGWEMLATILSMQHERYIKDLSDNVFRGQEGNVLAGLSVGDYCFGYGSEPLPSSDKPRRGRNAKPQKIYVINRETASWVMRIFHWFAVERRGLSWIARELNRLKAPKDHRASTPLWRHQQLPDLLRNPKYIGWWGWGQRKNVRDPTTGQITQELRPEEEMEKWMRHFPHLQIIDNETFELAERRLQENEDKYNRSRREDGKFNGSTSEAATAEPRHLLSGLLECEHCRSNWHVGGVKARYMFCTGHKRGICDCQTKLRRDRAERLILGAIGRQIIADPAWRRAVLDGMSTAWRDCQQTIPSELKSAEDALADVERKIARLVDVVEQGAQDPDILKRLADRRSERQPLLKDVERLRRAHETSMPEPTEEWAAEQLQCLSATLSGGGPAAAHALRDLVGGKIFVKQIERPNRKRHYLQGRFAIRLASVVDIASGGRLVSAPGDEGAGDHQVEFVIDFVEPDVNDALAETAKRYYDQGLLNKAIAQEMGVWPSQVTKLLKHWCQLSGQSLPDARTRRASLPRKTMAVRRYEQIADQAVELMHRGYSDAKIGRLLGCSDFVAAKAIRHWHRIRNLPTPTRKQRREALARRAQQLLATQAPMKAIAIELGCSMPTLRRLLEIAHRLDGQIRPDGRSRKGWPTKDESDPEGDRHTGVA